MIDFQGKPPQEKGTWGVRRVDKVHNELGIRVDKEVLSETGEIDMPKNIEQKPMATIGLSRGLSLNLGNYESAKADVWCSLPCEATPVAMEAAYKKAQDFCEKKIADAVSDIRSE